MSSEIQPDKSASALNDRLFTVFTDGWEMIAIQAGYRFGWYSALARGGPYTASHLATLSGTGPRFTEEWLREQTAAGMVEADLAATEPKFRLSPEVAEVLLGESGTGENALAAMLSEVFADWMQLAQRLVEGWRHDRSGYTDADLATLAGQQARFTALTAVDLPGILAAIPELAGVLARQPLRVADLGCGGGFYLGAVATAWPTAELIGYDPDSVAVALAAERLGSNPRIRLRQADARRVADDRPFDLIVAVDALHDMADPSGVLSAARSALADGGVIAIAEGRAYPSEFSGQPNPAERLGYLTSLFNCLHHQIEHSGPDAVGAVVREKDIRAWGAAAGLPSCAVYDADDESLRLFVLRSA
jgi:SAM-dependent methyltransferase